MPETQIAQLCGGPLLQDGTLRPTAVRNPARYPRLIPMALRIRCRPSRIKAIAA